MCECLEGKEAFSEVQPHTSPIMVDVRVCARPQAGVQSQPGQCHQHPSTGVTVPCNLSDKQPSCMWKPSAKQPLGSYVVSLFGLLTHNLILFQANKLRRGAAHAKQVL